MAEYTIVRSKRKTLELYVRNGKVEVRAPLKLAKQEIERFVASKEDWINEKLAASRERIKQREEFALDYGSRILLMGKEFPVTEMSGTEAGFNGTEFYFPPNLSSEQIKQSCIKIYRKSAKTVLDDRVAIYAPRMGVEPVSVKISAAKKCWGSCTTLKSLNFSWRLAMGSLDVIDYVVVHELAHLCEMNHSARFWAVVENALPDYRERKAQLRELSKRLAYENWT